MTADVFARDMMPARLHARRRRGAFKVVLVCKCRSDGRQSNGGCKSDRNEFHGSAPLFVQDGCLRARLVTQSCVTLKAPCITKFNISFTQLSWSLARVQKMICIQSFTQRTDAKVGLTRQSHSRQSMLPCVACVRDERCRQILIQSNDRDDQQIEFESLRDDSG
jgi:hypothetical protein